MKKSIEAARNRNRRQDEIGSSQALPWSVRLPMWILLSAWVLFGLGTATEYGYGAYKHGIASQIVILCITALTPFLARLLLDRRRRWWPPIAQVLDEHTAAISAIPTRRIGLWIAAAAGLGLYAELALIRFHGSCFQLFAFFKNLSLLSCFLGLGMGYTIGNHRRLYTPLVLPGIALQMIFLHVLRFTDLAQTLHNPIREELALGLTQMEDLMHVLTVYGFLICIFCVNALCFIPLGHLAGSLMGRTKRLPAYSWNLAGSLAGVLLFYLLSYFWTGPILWTAVLILVLILFLPGRSSRFVTAGTAAVLLGVLGLSVSVDSYDVYSPYQILSIGLSKDPHPQIKVNHVYFQKILDLSSAAQSSNHDLVTAERYYGLPYHFKPNPDDVMIVGAGTGNDVASALRHLAGHVDAVEIDPAILHFGRTLHPEQPYSSPRVDAHVQDARAFIRYSPRKYDLIVFGLLDSHTLLSSLSGVRLDSYIYTTDSFRDARRRLKEGGVICLTFVMLTPEIGRKLYLMLKEAFGGIEPVVFETSYDGGYSFVIGEHLPPAVRTSPVAGLKLVTSTFSDDRIVADPSTDDWPFFYMGVRKYPVTYVTMILVLLAVSAVFIWPLFAGAREAGEGMGAFSAPCFFLGAGFMLLETKAITELALVYGSTWVVTAIVITAILIMAFLANLLLVRIGRVRPILAYGLLLASLALSLAFAMLKLRADFFGGQLPAALVATAIITLPIFFAGLAFSSELASAPSAGVALGSNLMGAMLGGCLEYNSMYFGYRSLYIIALVIYALALATSVRGARNTRANP